MHMCYKGRVLVISQVYVPDPAAVGQHMHDVAACLASRGFRVDVYSSARGYENPAVRYAGREILNGVHIRRLPLSSFGKSSISLRLLGGFVFIVQGMLLGLLTRNLNAVLISTSPPMAPLAAIFIRMIRRKLVIFWVMDINPDQMIAAGKLSKHSIFAWCFNRMYHSILSISSRVIALDTFMAKRLKKKCPCDEKIAVIPPWSHHHVREPIPHENNPFRQDQGLRGRFVLMYSGNISLVHPLDTLLEAAYRLQDDPRILFMFIGGGVGRTLIDQFIQDRNICNVRLLPYQPLKQIQYSLSAADVHIVTMGNNMVGIVHPCKIYGAMSVGRPVLLLGPKRSHIGEIMANHQIGWHIEHGNVQQAVDLIRKIAVMDQTELIRLGENAKLAVDKIYSKSKSCGRVCDIIESCVRVK